MNDVLLPPDSTSRPTKIRFVVLVLLCSLAFVLYIDRVCISQAAVPIKEELGLSDTQMSFVFMAFTLAYGLFEVPTGHWGDRVGSRAVLTRISIWWSAFTALTAACNQFWTLLVVRFLFGAGEAGALPNMARVVARWFSTAERGRIQGLIQTSMLLGGAAAPAVAAWLIALLGWRGAFLVFGSLGIVWAAVFWLYFRDEPAHHWAINAAELAHIGSTGPIGVTAHTAIPWRAVVVNPSVWLLSAIMIFASFNSYFYFSWFPSYLQKGRGLSNAEAGLLASLVLGGGAIGSLSGGLLIDRVAQLGRDPIVARRWLCGGAFALAAGFLVLALTWESATGLAIGCALSCLCAMSTQAGWWSSVIEISGRHLGALFGLMNGLGVFGAMGSQFFFGAFADWRKALGYAGREQYDPAFVAYVVALLLAALCWACYRSFKVESNP